jgi:phosphoribosylaminoimidazole carboxylase PurE protein
MINKTKVAIIAGSDTDLPVIAETIKLLENFGVKYCVSVASAHRTPAMVEKYVAQAEKNGAQVFIAAAGMAAALPGVVASKTLLPVIGIPIESKTLGGIDALFSIVQMPPGIPVATVAIGKAGAKNAALLAVQILSLKDAALNKKMAAYRKKNGDTIIEKDKRLQRLGIHKYMEINK